MAKYNITSTLVSTVLIAIALTACGGGGSGGNGSTDTTAPVITLNGNATENITVGTVYTDAGATAEDNVDGNISANITIGGDTVDTATVGSYTITYNVSDSVGNAAVQLTRTVTVSTVASNGIVTFVAYTVDDSTTNNDRIYIVRGNGTDHQDLHPNIPSGGEISAYSWAPTANGRMAYLGDVDIDTVDELYSVDPDSNSRVKLNGILPSGGDVIDYQWSPDGTKIAYRANQDDFGKVELYVVDSDGQNLEKVNTTLVGGGNVEEFLWSPASSHVLYRADDSVNDQFNWHVATSSGSTSNQVNVNLGTGETVTSVRWSPLGSYIDYIHDLIGNADVDLYIFKLSDSTNTKMDTFTFANTQDYEWSSSEQHFAVGLQFGGVSVYSFDGSSVVNISNIHAFEFIPDTENLVATQFASSTQFKDFSIGIYAADGSVINAQFTYAGNTLGTPQNFSFSPDAQKITFEFDEQNSFSGGGIYVYDPNTNSAINISTIVNFSALDQSDISWSQDSTRILVNRLSKILSISPDGSGLVDLATSTSAASAFVLHDAQWGGNNIYLQRNTGISAVFGDILKVDKNGQSPFVIANSGTTHAFYCENTFCFNDTAATFELSNDTSFVTYKSVGDLTSSAGDDLHVLKVDGTGDVSISIDLDPSLGLRISEYSIQPVN